MTLFAALKRLGLVHHIQTEAIPFEPMISGEWTVAAC